MRTNDHFVIMSKDSEVLLSLTALKLIKKSQVLLTSDWSRDPNSITREMHNYIEDYLEILGWFKESHVFKQENRSHSNYIIWKFP